VAAFFGNDRASSKLRAAASSAAPLASAGGP